MLHLSDQRSCAVLYSSHSATWRELVNCQIWDTAGQDRFSCISKEYYRGANGCLLVYDITDELSFSKIDHWYQELLTYAHTAEEPVTVIVGNKSDLKNQAKVKSEDAAAYAKAHNMLFFETSAKLNYNVEEAFRFVVEDIVHKMKNHQVSLGPKIEIAKTQSIRLEPEVSLDESEQQVTTGNDKKKEDTCKC